MLESFLSITTYNYIAPASLFDFFKVNDNKHDDEEENEKQRRDMRLKIKKQLGILDLKKPRWRYKETDEKPHDDDIMKGKQLFRSIIKMVH